MKKRGISPLIATVLLIGLVVTIAIVVMTWGRSFVKERAEKEGALSQAQLECNQIEIEINEDKSITNTGSRVIDGFIVRTNEAANQEYTSLEPGGIITLKTSVGSEDEIIPCIKPEGAGAPLVPCSDKAIKLR